MRELHKIVNKLSNILAEKDIVESAKYQESFISQLSHFVKEKTPNSY